MDYFCTTNPSSSGFSSAVNSGQAKKKGGKRSTKGVKLSTDPQSVAVMERRHRISDRFKILQSLVPGGSKMDTVSMLEEAIHYVKFLKTQIWLHQTMINVVDDQDPSSCFLAAAAAAANSFPFPQQTFYHDQVQPSPPPVPLQNSCFQSEETVSFNPYVKY